MYNKKMQNKNLIIVVIAVAVLAGVGFWYWREKKTVSVVPEANVPITEKAGESIGGEIFEKTQNPIKNNLPETNPLKKIIKNPF